MPRITSDKIEFLVTDRQVISERSNGITADGYAALFANAIKDGDTAYLFKFFEEIAEKDPDIMQALDTRSSYVTAKEWQIVDEEGEENDDTANIAMALHEIQGSKEDGLLTLDELIHSMLGVSYLTGLSFSEIVTDTKEIIGFNYIPCHFLTFRDSVFYPNLWTETNPIGEPFNRDKMIGHYLNPGSDPVRGYLGNAISWQYVFKRSTLDARLKFEKKYGKGFLLVNMPTERDGFEENWDTAESLIENYSDVDGAVFEGEVEVDFKESIQSEGEYFWDAEDQYKQNIIRIILGQESTTSSESSNRSTAEVHMQVLEQRILKDIAGIEDTLNRQLIPKIKELLGIADSKNYYFKFVLSEMEATLDEDIEEEGAIEEDGAMPSEPVTQAEGNEDE